MDSTVIFSILWIALALFVGMLFSKLMKVIHFPNVTGFLIAGILIGPWVLGWIDQDGFNNILNEISWVSEIALGFIAFTIGGSFRSSSLKQVGKRAVIISILEALGGSVIVIVGLFIAYFCGMKNHGLSISMILTLGAIACATAPAATLLVIHQYEAKGPLTDTLIPVVAFDDAVALIMFSLLFSIAKVLQAGVAFDVVTALIIPMLEIIVSLVLGAGIGFLISFATRWFRSRHNRLILVIAAVFISVGLAEIDTKTLFGWSFSFQISSLLTLMTVGGVYINFAKGLDTTNMFLDKLTSPVYMLFFVISGARLNFGVFGTNKAGIVIAIAAIYIITRVVGKWLGAALGCKITKSPKVVDEFLGFALVPQAGVALGLANTAQVFMSSLGNEDAAELGLLIYTIIIVSTMVYELVGPIITKWALTKAGEINPEKVAE